MNEGYQQIIEILNASSKYVQSTLALYEAYEDIHNDIMHDPELEDYQGEYESLLLNVFKSKIGAEVDLNSLEDAVDLLKEKKEACDVLRDHVAKKMVI